MRINQDAVVFVGDFDAGHSVRYQARKAGNGVYLFVIDGEIEAAGETLTRRDAIGIDDVAELDIKSLADSQLLFIDVPMA